MSNILFSKDPTRRYKFYISHLTRGMLARSVVSAGSMAPGGISVRSNGSLKSLEAQITQVVTNARI